MRRLASWGLISLIALSVVACGEKEEDEGEEANEAAAVTATPGQPVPITEESPGLLAKAMIQPEQARQIVLKEVPNGTITKAELEEEDGTLIYSFDVKKPGEEGITELHVDAKTGKIIKTEHEGG